ncbi:MAG: hypothetical protein K2J39_04525 [Ruminococcus sp.]|nr:hypothetical protein [Ruminococcus sp.]
MKKMNILLSAIILLTSAIMPTTTFATDDTATGGSAISDTPNTELTDSDATDATTTSGVKQVEGDKNVVLAKTYAESYVINIPPGTTKKGEKLENGKKFEISATANFAYGKEMKVTVKSANNWQLIDKKDRGTIKTETYEDGRTAEWTVYDHPVNYDMVIEGTNQSVKDSNTVFTLKAGEEVDGEKINTKTVTLVAKNVEAPKYAGTYTDTLTFSAIVFKTEKKAEETSQEDGKETTTEETPSSEGQTPEDSGDGQN